MKKRIMVFCITGTQHYIAITCTDRAQGREWIALRRPNIKTDKKHLKFVCFRSASYILKEFCGLFLG